MEGGKLMIYEIIVGIIIGAIIAGTRGAVAGCIVASIICIWRGHSSSSSQVTVIK